MLKRPPLVSLGLLFQEKEKGGKKGAEFEMESRKSLVRPLLKKKKTKGRPLLSSCCTTGQLRRWHNNMERKKVNSVY
jgi:hypothetical protein